MSEQQQNKSPEALEAAREFEAEREQAEKMREAQVVGAQANILATSAAGNSMQAKANLLNAIAFAVYCAVPCGIWAAIKVLWP